MTHLVIDTGARSATRSRERGTTFSFRGKVLCAAALGCTAFWAAIITLGVAAIRS